MRLLPILGLLTGVFVLFLGLRFSSENLGMFIDPTSAFIVLGGTFAASAITFRLDRIFVLFKIFLSHLAGNTSTKSTLLIERMIKISDSYRRGENLSSLIPNEKDFFLKDALEMINDGVLKEDEIIEILEERNSNLNFFRNDEANKLRILGQYPPAFGMMGTTIGMIVLLANLGGEDAIKIIGPAMSVCLITTLYGVIIANLIFIPIAENLSEGNKTETLKNAIIIEGIRLLMKKTNPILMAERLNSYLRPHERLNWKKVLGR